MSRPERALFDRLELPLHCRERVRGKVIRAVWCLTCSKPLTSILSLCKRERLAQLTRRSECELISLIVGATSDHLTRSSPLPRLAAYCSLSGNCGMDRAGI